MKQRVESRDDFDNWGYTRMVAMSNGVSEPQMKREMTSLKRVQGVSVLASLTGGFWATKAPTEHLQISERAMRSDRGPEPGFRGSGPPPVALTWTRKELKRLSEGLSLEIEEYRQSLRKVHLCEYQSDCVLSSREYEHV